MTCRSPSLFLYVEQAPDPGWGGWVQVQYRCTPSAGGVCTLIVCIILIHGKCSRYKANTGIIMLPCVILKEVWYSAVGIHEGGGGGGWKKKYRAFILNWQCGYPKNYRGRFTVCCNWNGLLRWSTTTQNKYNACIIVFNTDIITTYIVLYYFLYSGMHVFIQPTDLFSLFIKMRWKPPKCHLVIEERKLNHHTSS